MKAKFWIIFVIIPLVSASSRLRNSLFHAKKISTSRKLETINSAADKAFSATLIAIQLSVISFAMASFLPPPQDQLWVMMKFNPEAPIEDQIQLLSAHIRNVNHALWSDRSVKEAIKLMKKSFSSNSKDEN